MADVPTSDHGEPLAWLRARERSYEEIQIHRTLALPKTTRRPSRRLLHRERQQGCLRETGEGF